MVPYTQLEDLQRGNKSNNSGVEPLATASKVFPPLHLQTRPKQRKSKILPLVKTVSNVSLELTSLLTLSREDLNLNALVFLSRGLMVNYRLRRAKTTTQKKTTICQWGWVKTLISNSRSGHFLVIKFNKLLNTRQCDSAQNQQIGYIFSVQCIHIKLFSNYYNPSRIFPTSLSL